MNIPITWLNEYVDIKNIPIQKFAHDITMLGQKVESIIEMGDNIKKVVVGKILKLEKHPDADKLLVAKVDVGGKILNAVTGAPNVFEGAYVPFALEGAVMANGQIIEKGSIRGVVSEGMMCSIEELGYTRNDYPEAPENGIYIFGEEQALGEDVIPILMLKESVVEFEITSNRPDCNSVIGIARETAATYETELKMPDLTLKEEGGGKSSDYITVEINNPELCPRYIARVVKNVKIENSPLWMRHRLTAAGMRPINNIVDITNYVMLELGQPMHAFDIDDIDGGIIVRNAKEGEKIVTLDGNERNLDPSMLVISDKSKAVAIAGIMGGENSKVSGNASAILFESANFNGTNIRLSSKKLGLRTDSSSKYEKGLDPNLAEIAVNRALNLVELLGAGDVVQGIVDCYPNKQEAHYVDFDADKINNRLGTNIEANVMDDYLKKFDIILDDSKKRALIPTFRKDVECIEDLSEEIARKFGYENILPTLITATPTVGKKTYKQEVLDIIKNTLVSSGFYESFIYSFESPKVFGKLLIEESSNLRNAIEIMNPLGEDYSIMRTTSINGMMESLSNNFNKRNESANLFEISNIYRADSLPLTGLPNEINMITIGMYGKSDFYDIKGVVEELAEIIGINDIDFTPESNISWYHPGRCAKILIEDTDIGEIGEIHPEVCENYDIGTRVYIATIELEKITKFSSMDRRYKELPKFPAITRDIALIVPEDILIKDIENIIFKNGGELLNSCKLFDIYQGSQIKENHKSVAYSLLFRSHKRTLIDEEVNIIMENILSALKLSGTELRA